MTDHVYTVRWGDVRDEFLSLMAGKRSPQKEGRRLAGEWKEDSRERFMGCKSAEMREWVQMGFHAPAFQAVSLLNSESDGRGKFHFDEDGEMLIDLALSGFDYPFLARKPTAPNPGVHIIVNYSLSAGVKAEVIAQYGAWLAGLLNRLEVEGVDTTVDVQNRVKGSLQQRKHAYEVTRVRVKQEGEMSDFSSWSALFSPGGFRMLMWTAKIMGADAKGLTLCQSLGTPANPPGGWRVSYDRDAKAIMVTCPNQPQGFDAAAMDASLTRALAQAQAA